MKHNIDFKVRVSCFTFNHAPYIQDAMNGFTMQQTSFPYVCTIVDDASTDGESDVIRQYLNEHFILTDSVFFRDEENEDYRLFFAQHKENANCYFAVVLLKYNHYSIRKSKLPYYKEWTNTKYIAICEGDDIWIDPNKLHEQYDFMEQHENIAMCTHAYRLVTKDNKPISDDHPQRTEGILDTGLIIENKLSPQTASFFFRSSLYKSMPAFFWQLDVADYPLRCFCAISGGVYYIDKVMSSYRKYTPGSWTAVVKKDEQKYSQHLSKLVTFAEKLDEYTNQQYHINVTKRIDYCEYLRSLNEGDYMRMRETQYYQSLNLRRRLDMFLQIKFPIFWFNLTKTLTKIKELC